MKTVKYRTTQNLQKKTVETLLNELFNLDNQDSNKQKMEQYPTEIEVAIHWFLVGIHPFQQNL